MANDASSVLGKILAVLWPIKRPELKKFLPLSLLMLCILFAFTSLRIVKDSLLVSNIGAEAISFVKLYCVVPSALLLMMLYVKLTNIMKYETIFYSLVSFFLVFLAIFAWILHPNAHLIHPSGERVEILVQQWPWFKWFIRLWGKWSYSAFYIVSELWGSMVLSLLFWQFANHITKTEEAKRFYSMFGLIGNIGIVLAGAVAVILTKYYPHNIIDYSVTLVIAAGIIAMAIYRWMHVYVLTDPRYYDQSKKARKKKKAKLTMLESFKMILSSRYIGYIFLIVLSYGMVINLVEGPWKDKIRHLYPGTAEYMNFTGKFMLAMGFTCIVFMILGANMLRYFGWLISAMTTPVMVLVTGLIFFICVVFGQRMQDVILNPLFVSVIIGAVQNILSKATKYSLFDATREMTYIPIDEDLKTKGKAAIDVVGARLAKSSGAVLQSSLFFLFPSFAFDDIVPILMVVFVLICIVWLYAVKNLNIEYNKALAAAESESYYE